MKCPHCQKTIPDALVRQESGKLLSKVPHRPRQMSSEEARRIGVAGLAKRYGKTVEEILAIGAKPARGANAPEKRAG